MEIVDRLRHAHESSQQRVVGSEIFKEAADEIERLRAALKPFADAANFFEVKRQFLTDEQLIVNHESVGWQCQLSLGNLKRAREAIIDSPTKKD